MEMCYDGALVMPSNYAVISEEEMNYVEGGNASLPMKKTYLRKSTCTATASGLYYSIQVTGMSIQQIAEEIYAHAVVFYRTVEALNVLNAGIVYPIYNSCKVIDIENGGDKRPGFMSAFSLVWKYI